MSRARPFKITFPHAALLFFLTLYPLQYAWKLRRHRLQRKRAKLGLCPHCGYDLRAATSDRCPECGITVQRNLQLT